MNGEACHEEGIRVVAIKEAVLADNSAAAEQMRRRLSSEGVFMLDMMGSPGSGKTTLLLDTIARMDTSRTVGVVEGDIASVVDAQKMQSAGVDVVQLRTGGACHIDIPMVEQALAAMRVDHDVIFIENVGNLVCPAEFETGAHKRVALLSVPEGYDKVLKYPLMFSIVDALVVSKCDTLPIFDDFDMDALEAGARALNPHIEIFPLSVKTGEGMGAWVDWLESQVG